MRGSIIGVKREAVRAQLSALLLGLLRGELCHTESSQDADGAVERVGVRDPNPGLRQVRGFETLDVLGWRESLVREHQD